MHEERTCDAARVSILTKLATRCSSLPSSPLGAAVDDDEEEGCGGSSVCAAAGAGAGAAASVTAAGASGFSAPVDALNSAMAIR